MIETSVNNNIKNKMAGLFSLPLCCYYRVEKETAADFDEKEKRSGETMRHNGKRDLYVIPEIQDYKVNIPETSYPMSQRHCEILMAKSQELERWKWFGRLIVLILVIIAVVIIYNLPSLHSQKTSSIDKNY